MNDDECNLSIYFATGNTGLDRDDALMGTGGTGNTGVTTSSSNMAKTSQGGIDLAVEQCQGIVSQLAKNALFGSSSI